MCVKDEWTKNVEKKKKSRINEVGGEIIIIIPIGSWAEVSESAVVEEAEINWMMKYEK